MKTILLVDDEKLLRDCVREVLELRGLAVIEAANGLQALELLETSAIDLVVTDIAMPLMNGVDFIVKLRETYTKLPVLLMTSSPAMAEAKYNYSHLLHVEVNASLTKPFSLNQLMSEVHILLEGAA